ncbi:DUF7547 family protein [Halorarum salinum]|uniref:Uncharacterized protein n=1 Tax=Halorarum salinum TaxID=2743089 RepID=A0A7D5LB95_9EURY|nr:hypothetical protein [Halobaculum salinum]QLG62673.1 hypothetical protein HUG12_13430 [Halobaculum salinum]
MSDRDARDDEDLAALLAELESTLSELRAELDDGRGREPRRGGDRGRWTPPRPPTPGELLRFTTDYTIPTVVATLRATIEALELLRRLLELGGGVDRGRAGDPGRSRLSPVLSGARDRAASDVTDALSRLRTELAEADLPEDEASRSVLEDARDLTAEIEERIAASRDAVDRERDRERRADAGDADDAVVIDVSDGGDDEDGADVDSSPSDGVEDGGEPRGNQQVDVDAELRSIKERMGKAGPPDAPVEGDDPDGSVAEDGEGTDEDHRGHDDEQSDE